MESDAVLRLVSLPSRSARTFREADPARAGSLFVAADPEGRQCGSGGGTAHLVAAAWRAQPAGTPPLSDWIARKRLLLVHGCGESRRLPAYAVPGKPLTPVPYLPGFPGQRPDQVLLDLQMRHYEYLFLHAPPSFRVLVTCGDVLLLSDSAPPRYPDVDVLIGGLHTTPAEASHHGVMICPAGDPTRLERFLQKPPAAELEQLAASHQFYLDTGVWFLSLRAVEVLFAHCGWNPAAGSFPDGIPNPYDLFGQFGPALGTRPSTPDPGVSALSCAVLPLPHARFYHFGTNRTLLESVSRLRQAGSDPHVAPTGTAAWAGRTPPVVLNARVEGDASRGRPMTWIENAHVPPGWSLVERHILTGIPDNDWKLSLEAGQCLDMLPVESDRWCVRPYGFDDVFRGPLQDAATLWIHQPVRRWFEARQISWEQAGLNPQQDIFDARIFPVLHPAQMKSSLLQWLFDAPARPDPDSRDQWLAAPRLSARELLDKADIVSLARQRRRRLQADLFQAGSEAWLETCGRLDLAATAQLVVQEQWPVPEPTRPPLSAPDLRAVHDDMFRYRLGVLRKTAGAENHAQNAFRRLRDALVGRAEQDPVHPMRSVLEDQIVWGRSPVRLDLAGGWTDTPPYCLEYGGHVTNVAVNLNGQPPIQVFGRFSARPDILLRSIDLGVDQPVRTYEDLCRYATLGDGFAIAKAALALAGLEPRFHEGHRHPSLEAQLRDDLGGGLELSMVCAIPKGSGLGTSSILAATLLGVLSDMLGLHWTQDDLFTRTMMLEQMLTSGGGWQDQVGGISGGIKLIATTPGLLQQPVLRWLPDGMFRDGCADRTVQLYYTGLTRVAHGILGEIVRGIFLNAGEHLAVLGAIGHNALYAADAIQRNDWPALCESIRRSWAMNQRLDAGTNPAPVQAILAAIERWKPCCKLLGAGGGGYLLILAPDADAGRAIRAALEARPPNARARFVEMDVSPHGIEVTRS